MHCICPAMLRSWPCQWVSIRSFRIDLQLGYQQSHGPSVPGDHSRSDAATFITKNKIKEAGS